MYEEAGQIEGLLIALLGMAPPVYDPGGLACTIDDFTVSDPALWPTVGVALLAAAQSWARAHGAAVVVVVCGHQDEPKRALLRAAGLSLTSEWYVNSL